MALALALTLCRQAMVKAGAELGEAGVKNLLSEAARDAFLKAAFGGTVVSAEQAFLAGGRGVVEAARTSFAALPAEGAAVASTQTAVNVNALRTLGSASGKAALGSTARAVAGGTIVGSLVDGAIATVESGIAVGRGEASVAVAARHVGQHAAIGGVAAGAGTLAATFATGAIATATAPAWVPIAVTGTVMIGAGLAVRAALKSVAGPTRFERDRAYRAASAP